MTETGFYRRPLPPGQVPFASDEGRALFREAMESGGLEGYFALAEQFHTQAEPAFCGLGTLVVALNALAIDPGRVWRGPWRWYGEEMLDCCEPLDRVRDRGVTLDQLACLARCNGAQVELRRAEGATIDAFRAAVMATTGSASGKVLVVGYTRRALGQTGEGHFSPVGGYHRARDLVLVLDVARFKYPPHWVPVGDLFEAMRPIDPATGRSRGWLTLTRGRGPSPLVYFVSCKAHSCGEVARGLGEGLRVAIADARPGTLDDVLTLLLRAVAPIAGAFTVRPSGEGPVRDTVQRLLDELRATEAYRRVSVLSGQLPAEAGALLAMSIPLASFGSIAPEALRAVRELRDPQRLSPMLREELERLADQLENLLELGAASSAPPAG